MTILLKEPCGNGGVFAFKLGYLLSKAHTLIEFTDYYDLVEKYETLTKISFDYAVVENESEIDVMYYSGQWNDLGTWATLTEAMEENIIGNANIDETCDGVYVLNELNISRALHGAAKRHRLREPRRYIGVGQGLALASSSRMWK